jgi:hypothetical protein
MTVNELACMIHRKPEDVIGSNQRLNSGVAVAGYQGARRVIYRPSAIQERCRVRIIPDVGGATISASFVLGFLSPFRSRMCA